MDIFDCAIFLFQPADCFNQIPHLFLELVAPVAPISYPEPGIFLFELVDPLSVSLWGGKLPEKSIGILEVVLEGGGELKEFFVLDLEPLVLKPKFLGGSPSPDQFSQVLGHSAGGLNHVPLDLAAGYLNLPVDAALPGNLAHLTAALLHPG